MQDYDKGFDTASEVATPRKGIDHIGMNLEQLFELANLAGAIADRIGGSLPTTNQKPPLASVPSSTSAALHDHAERMSIAGRRIRDALNRIDDAI